MSDSYQLLDANASLEDESFQYKVYAGTRSDEIASWGWDAVQQESFLRMQFSMQQRSYAAQYPGLHYQIVVWNGERAGHVLIVRMESFILLADIALLHQYRNKGVGTLVIKALQDEASQAGKAVRLRVMTSNVACRLYKRLGFQMIGEHGLHVEMEWMACE